MKINLEITETELRELVHDKLKRMLGEDISLETSDINIEVKSKQNYKSEWELASFRATVNKII